MRTSIFLTIVSTIALTVSAGHNQLKRRNTGSGGNSIEGTLAGDIAALQLDLTNLDIDFSKVVLYDAATAAINRVILQYALTLENLELTFCKPLAFVLNRSLSFTEVFMLLPQTN
jgi:hypothetical protein